MRTGKFLAVGLLLLSAACSNDDNNSGQGPGTTGVTATAEDNSATTGQPEAATGGESTGTTSPVTTDADPAPPAAPPIEVTELPGLVDTSDEPLPDSIEVKTGTLDNGLTYYIKQNDRPGSKVSLWLAVDAGSTDELDAVTGVAHFAEHMMFNGTEQYPKNELVDVLRSFGAQFGADVNAYTSWNETVYQLTVPHNDDAVNEGLNVLNQWLNAATITPEDTTAERGVVLDEWRTSTQTETGRLNELASAYYLEGTRYEGRSPIGTKDDISSMEPPTLRQYYDRWYRPDNVAIVVVGDIDVDEMEEKIRQQFEASTPRNDEPIVEDERVEFPKWDKPSLLLHSDPDQSTVDVEVTLPLNAIDSTGTLSLRATTIDELIFDALIRRLDRDVSAGEAPFDEIVRGTNSLVDELDAPALYAKGDAAHVTETLDALLVECERAFRYGFSQKETEQVVESSRTFWDSYLAEDSQRQDYSYAEDFTSHFLDGGSNTRIKDWHAAAIAELDKITPEVLHERFKARWTNTTPQVIIQTPDAEEAQMPSKAEVLKLIEEVPTRDIEPRPELADLPEKLMERPAPVESVGETELHDYSWDIFEPVSYAYPSGARVVINSTDIEEGRVYLYAFSPGGSSMVADEDVVDALYASDVVTTSGIADYTAAEFAQIMSNADAAVFPSIGVYDDRFLGEASSVDLESMLAQMHLYMTKPRFDNSALERLVRSEQPVVNDPSIEPQQAGRDALYDARYQGQLRYTLIPEPAQFATLDLAGVERVWHDRFSNASDWTFVIVGDIEAEEALELADSYIGTLPGDGTIDQPSGVSPPVPEGVTAVEATGGSGETATLEILFTSPLDEISVVNQAKIDVSNALLGNRMKNVIREEYGDSYSPSVYSYMSEDPNPVVITTVTITGAPERLDAIAATAIAQLADIENGGVTDDEFSGAYESEFEEYGFINNSEFATQIEYEMRIPDYDLVEYLTKQEVLQSIDRSEATEFIKTHVNIENYVQSTTRPR